MKPQVMYRGVFTSRDLHGEDLSQLAIGGVSRNVGWHTVCSIHTRHGFHFGSIEEIASLDRVREQEQRTGILTTVRTVMGK